MLGFTLPWIIAHLVGDFVIQNDWMTANKKKSNYVCFIHIFTYIIPFIFTALNPLQLLLISVQHYIQDRTYFITWFCRKTKKFQSELNNTSLPWGHIIVDNIFHIVFIWLIVTYI